MCSHAHSFKWSRIEPCPEEFSLIWLAGITYNNIWKVKKMISGKIRLFLLNTEDDPQLLSSVRIFSQIFEDERINMSSGRISSHLTTVMCFTPQPLLPRRKKKKNHPNLMAQKPDFLKGSLEEFCLKNCMPQMILQLLRIIYSGRQIQWVFLFCFEPRSPSLSNSSCRALNPR